MEKVGQYMFNRPIFVVGQARGGTTVFRDVLRAHPTIDGSFGESQFFRFYYNQYGDLEVDKNLDRLLDDFLETFFFEETDLDPKAIRSLLHNGDRTYKSVLATIMATFINESKAERWVEKSPDHLLHMGVILKLFPEAQILHIIRDARDVACSTLKREEKSNKYSASERLDRLLSLSLQWHRRAIMGLEYRRDKGEETYKIIRYEDLIFQTQDTLRELSRFLRLEPVLTQAMLDRAAESMKSSLAKPWSSFDDEGQGLLTAPVGRYRGYLSEAETASIEFLAGRMLKVCGYEISDAHLRFKSMIRLISRFLRRPKSAYHFIGGLISGLSLELQGRESLDMCLEGNSDVQ